jgi:hypothetical protein
MKKTLLILAALISPFFKAQVNPNFPTINIWRVLPQNACPGDTLRVNFKFNPPSQGTLTNSYFIIKSASTYSTAWQGNWNTFYSLPKETWSPLAWNDSCYLIKLVVPFGLTACSCASVQSTGDYLGFTLNGCATHIIEQSVNSESNAIYYDLFGNTIDPRPNELIIQQNGFMRKKIIIVR